MQINNAYLKNQFSYKLLDMNMEKKRKEKRKENLTHDDDLGLAQYQPGNISKASHNIFK